MRDRIAFPRIGAEADDEQARAEPRDRLQRFGLGGAERINLGAARQRQVECRAFAFAIADLVGVTPEEGIVGRRVGMERGVEDIAALPENVLGAVAVMIVDVEDGDAPDAAVARQLGGDGGDVDMALAAIMVAAGMMAGRPA